MSEKKIKHAVISGGGHTIFCTLGAIQQLEQNGRWNVNDIETIYGTSAGCVAATILCLKFDWETINDYFIKRPWQDAFPISASVIFDAYSNRGIFDKKFIETIFKPLFNAKDISMNITMKDFFEYSNIEIHFFSLEVHDFQIIDISYKTHPDLELLTAIYMSSAIPIIFSPFLKDGKCYVDGGIVCNYPLKYCMDKEVDIHEIIGFKNEYEESENSISVTENSSILDYVMCFLYKLIYTVDTERKQEKITNEIIYKIPHISFSYLKEVLSSQETRNELLERGKASV
jgi:predicted acylesterase/phospholipase RssA